MAYQQQHLGDLYREDVGQINDQASSLAKEKGLYQSSLLDQLISGDRSSRHDANVKAAKLQFTADQNLLDNSAERSGTHIIGAGIDPNTGLTLPGHGPKPKQKPRATPIEQSNAETDYAQAFTNAQAAAGAGQSASAIAKALSTGRKAKAGQTVYENVPEVDQFGNVIKGKTKRQPKLDPKTGTVVTTGGREAVDPVNPAIAVAAAEMATQGFLSPHTVKELHRLGFAVRGFPGVKTQFDRPKRQPIGRPGTAVDPASGGQQRPT